MQSRLYGNYSQKVLLYALFNRKEILKMFYHDSADRMFNQLQHLKYDETQNDQIIIKITNTGSKVLAL